MSEDEDDPRRRFRVIDGLPEKPYPREASWPRRYRVGRRTRSVYRPRSGPYTAEHLVKIGVLVREAKPGSSRRRPRRKWGAPPFRAEERKARDRLRRATREEREQIVRDAWKTVLDLRRRFPFCEGIDPDGTGGWGGPVEPGPGTRAKPLEEIRTPRSWDEVKPGTRCRLVFLPGELLIESVGQHEDGRPFATCVDELGVRGNIELLELLELCEETTQEEGAEPRSRGLLADSRARRPARRPDWGVDPNG